MTDATKETEKRIERARELDKNASDDWEIADISASDRIEIVDENGKFVASVRADDPGNVYFMINSRVLLPSIAADLKQALSDLAETRATLAQQVENSAKTIHYLADRDRMKKELTEEVINRQEAEAKIADQDERIAELHRQREEARTALMQAQLDKAALAKGLRLYRAESPPFAVPAQIAEWERDHGALVLEDEKENPDPSNAASSKA